MAEPATMRDRILDAAERRARQGGYHGFSFRDLAAEVGVKSASVHHHFPTKADLAEALARRYADRAMDRLGSPDGIGPAEAVARVNALFREALRVEDRMCLCGLFGAERDALPPPVASATADYFRRVLGFLGAALGGDRGAAAAVLARLEGALILARTLGDPALFDAVVAEPGRAG